MRKVNVTSTALLAGALSAACARSDDARPHDPLAREPFAADGKGARAAAPLGSDAETRLEPRHTASVEGTASASAALPLSDEAGAPAHDDVLVWPGRGYVDERAGDRVYAKARFVWIQAQPGGGGGWIGYLTLGDSVRVKDGDAARAQVGGATGGTGGCSAWYAIEPFGYVCTGEDATLDRDDPAVATLRTTAANPLSPWPYRYGESLGTPVYSALPDEARQRSTEIDFEAHRAALARARKIAPAATDPLFGVDLRPASDAPPPFPELPARGRPVGSRVVRGSTIAYTKRFAAAGRSWLLTWDRALIPQDRVRPYPESHFAGVVLAGAAVADAVAPRPSLPLAFFRVKERPKYRRAPDGSFAAVAGETFPRHGWVALTGTRVAAERAYLETREDGVYCAEDDATVLRAVEELPARVRFDSAANARTKWIEVSVDGGWLIAYEGATPVYATLISPGRGGVPFPGINPVSTASTPVGQFAVTGKFLTATMISSSDSNIVHAEVQYTQNFSGPHALHGAYWHDAWGEKKSGGCVNLSPIDARRVFAWTDPPLPLGWHGVRADTAGRAGGPEAGRMTVVVIHR